MGIAKIARITEIGSKYTTTSSSNVVISMTKIVRITETGSTLKLPEALRLPMA